MKTFIVKLTTISLAVMFGTVCAFAQLSSGGPYALEQAAIANGGGASTSGTYTVEGTVGQAAAGTGMTGGAYFMRGGFWTPAPFSPTAANVSISGHVFYGQGIGIKNVSVIMSGGNLTTPRVAVTNQTGLFLFEDVAAGQSYVLSISSKKFTFTEGVKFFSVFDSMSDLVFQADWGDK
jgi:hypothetical protein